MRLVCELAAPFVANSAVGGQEVIVPFRGHTESCLRCQARHVAMVRAARELANMSDESFRAPADMEWRVMSSLEGDLAVASSIKAPLALLAAALSMAAAFLIWRLRPRTG